MASQTNLTNLHTKFLKELEDKGRSHSTIIAYGKDIEQLIEFLTKKDVTDVAAVDFKLLGDFKKSLEGADFTNKTISRKINSIRTFYRYLLDKKVISENISLQLEHPKFETSPPRTLTETEYRVLRDVCRNDIRLYSIVELLLQSGIRIGELTRLELDDLMIDNGNPQKSMKIAAFGSHPARTVPLNNSATKAIQEYLEIRHKTDSKALYVTKNGNPLLVRNIRTSIDRSFKKAAIKDAKVNDLRNTFIAHQLAKGTSLVVVSQLVGHKRISTTEKYLGLVETGDDVSVELKDL